MNSFKHVLTLFHLILQISLKVKRACVFTFSLWMRKQGLKQTDLSCIVKPGLLTVGPELFPHTCEVSFSYTEC